MEVMEFKKKKVCWLTWSYPSQATVAWLRNNLGIDEDTPAFTSSIFETGEALNALHYGYFKAKIYPGDEHETPFWHGEIDGFLRTFSRKRRLDILFTCFDEDLADPDLVVRLFGIEELHLVEHEFRDRKKMRPLLQFQADHVWCPVIIDKLIKFKPLPHFLKRKLGCDELAYDMNMFRTQTERAQYIADAVLFADAATIYHRPPTLGTQPLNTLS